MEKRRLVHAICALGLVAGALTASSAVADEPGDDQLSAALDQLLADERYQGSQVGLRVADADTGEVLYDRGSDQRLIPASNTKLITSTAAMELLGEDYRFSTDVSANGKRAGKVLKGDLYLRGTGDPTLLAEDYRDLAHQVAESGITKVRGDLIADDTAYDSTRLGEDWAWDDLTGYYAAEVSALTVAPNTDYDAGTLIANVEPGHVGKAPKINTEPATDYLDFDVRATTVKAGGETDIGFERRLGTNQVVVTGQIAAGEEDRSWVTVSDPAGYAADVFASALKREGVKVGGDVRLGEATPAAAKQVAEHRSMPLGELLVPFLKLSNNGHAETLVKAIGREVGGEGSWDAGLAEIEEFAATMGMESADKRQADGSGLSRWNMIPPAEFTDLLISARDKSWYDTWYAALPIACEEDRFVGGTLSSRMCDSPAAGNVHAKTGSLTSVTGLSGYVSDADDRELVFSMISNNYLADSVKDVEDEVAITLAGYSEGAAKISPARVPQPHSTTSGDLECSWVKPATC